MRSQDFQHYRSMTRLVDSPITDPVPVATNNLAVLKHQAYESVFDFLAYKGHRIEQIPKMAQQETGSPSHAEWVRLNTVIEEAAREICQMQPLPGTDINLPQCDDYIRRGLTGPSARYQGRCCQGSGEAPSYSWRRCPPG